MFLAPFLIIDILNEIGLIPLPPYINCNCNKLDADQYQIIYKSFIGSIELLSEGLHFDELLLQFLKRKKLIFYMSHYI